MENLYATNYDKIDDLFKYSKQIVDNQLLNYDLENEELNRAFKYAMFPGRRIRPSLFLIFKYGGNLSSIPVEDLKIAAAIEIIHTTSVIVDDFIDDDCKRRSIDTFQKKYGSDVMTCFSHLMLSKAFETIGKCGNLKFLANALKVYGEMAKGELGDIFFYTPTKNATWLEKYKKIVEMKTGAIFGYSLLLSSKDKATYEKIGRQFGLFYQVSNDYYDEIYANSKERGLKEKYILNLTYPTACILDVCSENLKKWIISLLKKRIINKSELRELKVLYADKVNRESIKNQYVMIKEETIKSFQSLNKNEVNILNWALTKVEKSTFWNHGLLEEAGY